MNESVPIATLSGISSLTNLLEELPLPCPTTSRSQESLFSNSNTEKEAKKVVNRPDSGVIHQIKQALRSCKSSQDEIVLKDKISNQHGVLTAREGQSALLNTLLTQEPHLFTSENEKLELEDLLGLPSLCQAPISPQLSPNQTVPIASASPMYAGSPPGFGQVNSPYQQLHHSPSGVGSPLSYGQMPQAFSPHRTPAQSTIISPSHQVSYSAPSHLQATNQQSPVKTRRMRQSLTHLPSRDNTPSVPYQSTSPIQSGGQAALHTSPRARQSTTPINRNMVATSDLPSQNSTGYNSISALEALASSNGFTLDTNTTQNTMANSSKSITRSKDFVSSHNNQWMSQQAYTQKTDGLEPNNVMGHDHSVEVIDLNSQFSLDKANFDINYQDTSGGLDNSITETIDSGISLPATKKESKRKHTDRVTNKKNRYDPDRKNQQQDPTRNLQYQQDILTQDFPKTRRTSHSTENLRTENLNSSGENVDISQISPKKSVSDVIDLNKSVDLVYLDQSNIDSKVPSGFTPLKELQLCIPKLVITKIKERRGSKEIETHSVRTVMPCNDDEVVVQKKRRRSSEDTVIQSDAEPDQDRPKKKKKTKPKKFQDPIDEDDIMESANFKRFSTALENLFEFDDECGVSYMAEIDDEEPASESLASRTEISELYTETAKLKSLNVIHQVPSDQLMRLLSIMERHIRDGVLLKLNADQEDDDEQKLWKDLCLDRMIRSVESSLVVLNVLTAKDVPKQLYLEEVIERIIRLVKFHLNNNIFPEYDPVYRDPDNKDASVFLPKSKRSKATQPKVKLLNSFYNKMCELVSQLGDLVDIQALTDTSILQISSLGTAPFFVENISDLQHSSLKLVRSVFRRYVKHRDLILEDIFASLARLPSSKRNIRSYRLNGEESIQMVTALVLQLIQCSIKIPDKDTSSETVETTTEGKDNEEPVKVDEDIIICNSYENALRTAQNFLSMFLNKCSSVGKDEEDFRPLFENFLQDLLLMLNKPDWPVAEVLLTLLGKLLIVTFNNKSLDVSLRVSSIDYLGVVAAHLRKDGVLSHQVESESISDMLIDLLGDTSDESDGEVSKWDERSAKRIHVLRKALLHYLTVEGQNDPAFMFAKKFYIAQWIRDAQIEKERAMRNPSDLPSEMMDGLNSSLPLGVDSIQKSEEVIQKLHEMMDDRITNIRSVQHALDYDKALVVSRYLGSSRSFSKSFDGYLGQILRILNENVVAIRTKAMKALSAVVSVDPSILSRDDMQTGVHTRLVDMSTSVREAAVELIGRFVLNKPELIHQYYDMIIERILDTGISVRKRVIKILRDICISHPDFPKVTEICVKIIRRISDEEGIKELVTKVFQQMWFTPEKDVQKEVLLKRVVQMTEVVSACGENTDWFEQLLENLLRSDEDSIVKSSEEACNQIVDCLVENILRQEENVIAATEGQSSSSQKLVASLSTLYLMSKIKPQLLVNHGATLQPYLSTKCSTQGDYLVIHNVARILELVVPLMKHTSETFLASLEEDLMRLTVKHGQTVVQSCISCLGAVVNKVTHNTKLVKDYFHKYYNFLVKAKMEHSRKNGKSNQISKPTLLRSLFTLGLLCKHFDFDADTKQTNQGSTKNRVFAVYIYFCKHEDEEVQQKALSGLGFFCIRYADLLMKDEAKNIYQDILSQTNESPKLKWQVLKNFQTHLLEEERRLRIQDHEWKKQSDKENLKELGDNQSGQTSAVMQVYLKDILEMFFHRQSQLRTAALTVVNLILRQGLVHPVQCVPYLIAAGTDNEQQTRIKSDQQLTDIDNKYSGFIQMKALAGTKKSFELQKLIYEGSSEPIRGFRKDTSTSLLSHMYSVVRTSRQPRRSILQGLLRMFDDHKKSKLDLLLFVSDTLAYFPYVIVDEPLFIMHHIDTMLSVFGAHLLQAFKESLVVKTKPVEEGTDPTTTPAVIDDDDVDDNIETIISRIPEDSTQFAQHCISAQKCLLLLLLKEHLKELYGLTDGKCHKYSPSAPSKAYDKTVSRKPGVAFNPEQPLDYVMFPNKERSPEELAQIYYDFKCLMLRIDPPEEDSDVDSTGRDSPAVEGPPVLDADGNVIAKTPLPIKPKPRPRKTPAKGRKTPPVSKAKSKPKPRKKRKKITIDGDSDDDGGDLDPDFKYT